MLPLHHNTRVLLQYTSTTKRMLWMSKIEAVARTELSCQHLSGRTEDKEECLTANRRCMPLGTSETRNKTCTDIEPCTGRILTYTVFRQLQSIQNNSGSIPKTETFCRILKVSGLFTEDQRLTSRPIHHCPKNFQYITQSFQRLLRLRYSTLRLNTLHEKRPDHVIPDPFMFTKCNNFQYSTINNRCSKYSFIK